MPLISRIASGTLSFEEVMCLRKQKVWILHKYCNDVQSSSSKPCVRRCFSSLTRVRLTNLLMNCLCPIVFFCSDEFDLRQLVAVAVAVQMGAKLAVAHQLHDQLLSVFMTGGRRIEWMFIFCRGIKPCTSYSRTNDYVKLWLRHCVQLYAQQHHA